MSNFFLGGGWVWNSIKWLSTFLMFFLEKRHVTGGSYGAPNIFHSYFQQDVRHCWEIAIVFYNQRHFISDRYFTYFTYSFFFFFFPINHLPRTTTTTTTSIARLSLYHYRASRRPWTVVTGQETFPGTRFAGIRDGVTKPVEVSTTDCNSLLSQNASSLQCCSAQELHALGIAITVISGGALTEKSHAAILSPHLPSLIWDDVFMVHRSNLWSIFEQFFVSLFISSKYIFCTFFFSSFAVENLTKGSSREFDRRVVFKTTIFSLDFKRKVVYTVQVAALGCRLCCSINGLKHQREPSLLTLQQRHNWPYN